MGSGEYGTQIKYPAEEEVDINGTKYIRSFYYYNKVSTYNGDYKIAKEEQDIKIKPKEERINLMFSATIPEEVEEISYEFMNENCYLISTNKNKGNK